jgi:hypothetical protein
MAIIRNRWIPDTHQPAEGEPDTWFEYEWDDSVPVENRVHVAVAGKLRGVDQAPGQLVAAMNKVTGENQRKNFSIQTCIDTLAPGLVKQATDFGFSVAEDGTVTLTVGGVSQQQANAMKQALQGKYGNTVVLVTK